jgi:hypothetical protein
MKYNAELVCRIGRVHVYIYSLVTRITGYVLTVYCFILLMSAVSSEVVYV